ncbi:MAG: hypothetical protein KAT77_04230 [Nanoarchaeota archaeon]|nr:hypothetical protein [Nanoarchaeota archaeon]
MVTIKWCKKQNKGIKFIEPNDNLSKEYIRTAEETLDVLRIIKEKSKIWLATTKYYCEYFAIYSLLMKIGIKCEIHDCTIALCRVLEKAKILPEGYVKILERDKQLRIDNQYYLKNKDVPLDFEEITEFVFTLKDINTKLTHSQIIEIREKIKNN